MISNTNIEIILKNYNGVLDPISGKPFMQEKSNGETVPVAFTVGYKFRFDGEIYGSYIAFIGEEPGMDAIEEAANLVLWEALKSYKMLCSGAKDVPDRLFNTVAPDPIKVIETGKQEVDDAKSD